MIMSHQDLTGPWKLLHKSLQLNHFSVYLGTHRISSPKPLKRGSSARELHTRQQGPNEEGMV